MLYHRMAGVLGFEPRLTESKSVVLPLHYTPINLALRQPHRFGHGSRPLLPQDLQASIPQSATKPERIVVVTGAQGEIRTHGFADLQSTALGLSATCAYYWSRLQESNPYSQGRSLLYFPLYESETYLAYLQGLEPRRTVLETVMLPLHQRYILWYPKQDLNL